ncbi:MAG: tetratricopeptide repeat protein [Betaproteobacteria bacterium]|nr:tetratricopeptide repeat protein [Betaproteobacteria bacterium]
MTANVPASPSVSLPSGTVTLLFTDIEGSTRLWEQQGPAMGAALARHDELLRRSIGAHGGHVFKTVGDAFCAAFHTAADGLAAALDAQRALHVERWAESVQLRVRMALHIGAVEMRDGDYFGAPLNRVARLLSAGHGGQTLLTESMRDLCRDHLPPLASVKALGEHGLRDLARCETVFQLCHPDLPQAFPPLKSLGAPLDKEAPSVAVLPFVNMSRDDENEYFADGLAEELMNVLAKIRGLRVVSRTSAFYFKGKDIDIPTVAQKLNVATVLEGSVRKSGKRVRITAQLIQVANDSHLWSETYDRELDDVFAVQDDIAQSVVKELRAALLGAGAGRAASVDARAAVQAAVTGRTNDPEAWRLYLRGRSFLVGTQQEMDKSIDCFRQAVARAPDYAMAYAGLAEAYTTQAYLRAFDRTESVGKAQAAVTRALELDPDLAEAHTALGLVRFYFEWDWEGADAALRRALELNPGSQAANEEFGNFLITMGRLDEGFTRTSEATRLDPLSVGPVHNLAILAMIRGDYDQAAAGFRRAIDIDPNWTWGYTKLARTLARQGNCEEALAQAEIAERRLAGGAAPLSWSWLGVTYATCGDTVRARQMLERLHALEEKQYVDPVTFAQVHGALGEVEVALDWYEKAFADRTPNMVFTAILPGLSPELVGNPRYQAIVDRMGFPRAEG